jgi:hypothetical protein
MAALVVLWWCSRLCQVRPYRHPGLQRLATLLALVRACVLGLSVAFIPSAASDDESDVLIVGYVVAALHMVSTVGLALLCLMKAYRTYHGIHSSGYTFAKEVAVEHTAVAVSQNPLFVRGQPQDASSEMRSDTRSSGQATPGVPSPGAAAPSPSSPLSVRWRARCAPRAALSRCLSLRMSVCT